MNDPWYSLRQFTQARIAQGRVGHGQTSSSLLDFQLAHALARDAVHLPWNVEAFSHGVTALGMDTITLTTQVCDRVHYLKRSDLGRKLNETSREALLLRTKEESDIVFIFSNGLSSTAIETHGLALLTAIIDAFKPVTNALRLAPVCLVPNARVAVSDEIGVLLKAKLAVIVVGERPGLSAADSLGIYMTYNPNPDNTDAERNCISNIRPPDGLSYEAATSKLLYLSDQAFRNRISGVTLKDDMPGFNHQTRLTLDL